jgi:hypothetical protein
LRLGDRSATLPPEPAAAVEAMWLEIADWTSQETKGASQPLL